VGVSANKILVDKFKQLRGLGVLHAGVEVLQPGAEDPCLHRPENWLVRQLNDEPKLVYKVGFIREKGKATAREV
jgi:hypothetical protein